MKKVIVFYNFKGSVELEWLMPILFELKKKFYIFTIFRNKSAFKWLKKNNRSFNEWHKISNGSYIESKVDSFFLKFLVFIFKKILRNNYVVDKLRKKIYNTDILKKIIKRKTNYKNFEIPLFFSEFGHSSGWVDYLKKEGKIKTVHYPSNSQLYLGKGMNHYSLRGDKLFLNSYLDRKSFSKIFRKEDIIVSGNPKYDPYWTQKFYKKIDTKNKIIVAYISRFDLVDESYKKKLENQLIDLIEILNKLNKEIIFKIHPTKNSPHYKILLKKYEKFKWIESQKNLIELTKNCFCCITHPYSSAGFDAIMNSRPVLQLWPIKIDSDTEKQKLIKSNLYIKEKSSFVKLNLILTTKSPKDFSKKIRLISKKKITKKVNLKIKKIYPPQKNTIKRILDALEVLQKKSSKYIIN